MEGALRQCGGEPGLKLIETVLWDGASAPRWPLHLERLQRSAALLGWAQPLPPPPTGPDAAARLRLTLDAAGRMIWEQHPLPPAKPLWTLCLAAERLASDDPWLSVKSTRRALHDRARALLPDGVDEALFLNERGELCEGSITTLFFDRGEGMRTPPLACGLLPGVLRCELACPEEILLLRDLASVRLWVGNALRGLIPARLAEPDTAPA